MATIEFYEKPGCGSNTRQKNLLMEAGNELIVHNLLKTRWTGETLRPFFGQKPIADWFNRNAPRIKAGEIIPEAVDEETALALMVADPLLVRRPLIQIGTQKLSGFDIDTIQTLISGLSGMIEETERNRDFEACQHSVPCRSTKGYPS